jgi:O-antigen/teichoic acid export membrane protein
MSSIRKQTIISSLLVYIGFLVGVVNTYMYTKNGSFTPEQVGLTQIFLDLGQNIYVFASLAVIPVIYKFYPYYKDNLEDKKNDLLTWALMASLIGFCLVLLGGWYLEPLIVRKYSARSPLLVNYYYLIFPFALGMLLFSVIEGFCWVIQKAVISNFLKETVMRLVTSIFIFLFYFKVISFHIFIHLFTLLYFSIFIILLLYLHKNKQLHFTFTVSRVTKKFKKKMFQMQALLFGGTLIQSLAATIDSIVIAGFQNLGAVGVFTIAKYAANIIQVPQRSIQSISVGILSKAWKDKDLKEINRIYHRSSINLLLMSLFIFGNVWLNAKQGIETLHLQKEYLNGLSVIMILGFARIIDAGTGVNGFIIGTSTFWKFEFFSGVILLAFRLPLTWFLVKNYGIIGSAFAELAAYSAYNLVRFEFLRRKFNMQPFTLKTLYALLLAAFAYFICLITLNTIDGWAGIILRTVLFSSVMIAGIFYFQLTPDAHQLLDNFKKRIGR